VLDYNCPCQKEAGFFFLPVATATELVSAEMDILLDLWISSVYRDEQMQGSFDGPVAYGVRNRERQAKDHKVGQALSSDVNNIQDLDQPLHPFLDKTVMVPPGVGDVIAEIDHGMLVIGEGGRLRLRQDTTLVQRETGVTDKAGIHILRAALGFLARLFSASKTLHCSKANPPQKKSANQAYLMQPILS